MCDYWINVCWHLRNLAATESILNIDHTIHFYRGNEGGWYQLRSTVTLDMLARDLKLYAPVNYATAVEPYVMIIESIPWPVVMFTQGRLRYRYTIDVTNGFVNFIPNVIIGLEDTAESTLCSIPVSIVNPILQFNIRCSSARAHRDGAIGWLHRVFGNNTTTILWALGDMLYDCNNKRIFILYGPGGVGKSTVANIINTVIVGTIPSFRSDLVAINHKTFHRDNLCKED